MLCKRGLYIKKIIVYHDCVDISIKMIPYRIMNNIEKKVYNYIQAYKLINPKDTIIVGLSGGADSVCLLTIMSWLKDKCDINVKAVHINHGIRGMAADQDESFAKSLCHELDIPFVSYKKDIPGICAKTHETEEECGRRIRYEVFNEELSRLDSGKIAVAHHMNDQVETVLFRMARGTGVKGIAGMKPLNGSIIRPLLCLSRQEILEYLKDKGIDYCEDATNNELEYSRNYIRKVVVPDIEKVNDEAVKHICSLAEEVQSVMSYMDCKVEEILENARKACSSHIQVKGYSAKILWEQDSILRSYAIRKLIENEGLSLKDIHREHIEAIENILKNTESKEVCLPRGAKILVENGILSICNGAKMQVCSDYVEDINEDSTVYLPSNGVIRSRILNDFNIEDVPRNAYTKWFDYDKIQSGLVVRNRREDDEMVINSAGNRKKLSDYMINEKIPKSIRNEIPVIANGSQVIWVVGYRITETGKVTQDTKRVIEITYEREN